MNKIQIIELLKLRNKTELDQGQTVANAIETTGGNPTFEELAKANENAMKYYIQKMQEEQEKVRSLELQRQSLQIRNERLENSNTFLQFLKDSGVEEFEGYEKAQELMNEYLSSEQ